MTRILNSRSNNFLVQAKWLVITFSISSLAIIFGTIAFFPAITGHWVMFGIFFGIPGGVVFGLANYLTKNRWREIPFWILLGSLIGTISGFICFGVIIPGAFALIFFPEGMVWVIYFLVSILLIGLLGIYIFLAFELATQGSEFWNNWALFGSNKKIGLPPKG